MKIWREGTGLEVIYPENKDAFTRQMKYFTDCVRDKRYPELITPDESYEVIHMIDALHESAKTGQAVVLDSYEPFDFKN